MEQLLTLPEVAEKLVLSRSAIYRLVDAGRIPTIKVGGALRFAPSDLAAFLNSSRVEREPAPEPKRGRGRPRKAA